jgi:hypothetical protein
MTKIKIRKGEKFWCCPHPQRALDFAIAPRPGLNTTTGRPIKAKYIATCHECQEDGFVRTNVAFKLAEWRGDRPLVEGQAHPHIEVTSIFTH